jgi:aminoglycoside 2''-phosphotransferase
MDAAKALAAIRGAFPGLGVRELTKLGSGMDSDAFLADGEWVFRFPRRRDVREALGREVALLPRLAELLPVTVPRFEHVASGPEGLPLFAGYRLVPGRAIGPEDFLSLAPDEQEWVVSHVAAAMDALHGFPVAEAEAAGVERFSIQEWAEEAWAEGGEAASARLSAEDGRRLRQTVTDFLLAEASFRFKPALLHADFAEEHLLYDATGPSLALIDWGDLCIGDPTFEYLYMQQDYGADFVRQVLAHQGVAHPEPVMARVRLIEICDQLRWLATPPELKGGEDDSEGVLASLRRLLA